MGSYTKERGQMNDESGSTAMPPWSFIIEFDGERARRNGYDPDVLYDYVGRAAEPYGNMRVARGTWTAEQEGDGAGMAQCLALSLLSKQGWFMENVGSVTVCEKAGQAYDWLEDLKKIRPERFPA